MSNIVKISGYANRGLTSPEAEDIYQVVYLKKDMNRMVFFLDELGKEIELLRVNVKKGNEFIPLTRERLFKLKGKDLSSMPIELIGKRMEDSELVMFDGPLSFINEGFNFYLKQ